MEDRKSCHAPLYTAFIDAEKAFDRVDRSLLWHQMTQIDCGGKLLKACQEMYSDFKCCLRINHDLTDWFPSHYGVKQGCLISPSLFAIYINTLADELRDLGIGARMGVNVIPFLFYADDLVLMADSRDDLQKLLDALSDWCNHWRVSLNG